MVYLIQKYVQAGVRLLIPYVLLLKKASQPFKVICLSEAGSVHKAARDACYYAHDDLHFKEAPESVETSLGVHWCENAKACAFVSCCYM